MSSFKIDYSDIPINESISKFRKSKYIGMKNLYVNESLVVGDIEISDNHCRCTECEKYFCVSDTESEFDDRDVCKRCATDDMKYDSKDRYDITDSYRSSNTFYIELEMMDSVENINDIIYCLPKCKSIKFFRKKCGHIPCMEIEGEMSSCYMMFVNTVDFMTPGKLIFHLETRMKFIVLSCGKIHVEIAPESRIDLSYITKSDLNQCINL